MKKTRGSTNEIRRNVAEGHLLHYSSHFLQAAPTDDNATLLVAMSDLPDPVDVEELLSSRAIARSEVRQNGASSPQRLRNIMEKDVDVVPLSKAKLFYRHSMCVENVKNTLPEINDFLRAYSKDYLVIEHRFNHLSYVRQFADIASRRMDLVGILPHQFFETDLLDSSSFGFRWKCERCACPHVDNAKRFSFISNDSAASETSKEDILNRFDAFQALNGDFLIENIMESSLRLDDKFMYNKATERRQEIITLFPIPDKTSMIVDRQKPSLPNFLLSPRLHLCICNFSMNPLFEPIFLSVALYDVRIRQKISENFYFDSNPFSVPQQQLAFRALAQCKNALFAIHSHDIANVFVVFKMEKVLQSGDISECIEPYVKETKNREKLFQVAMENWQRLGGYRMPLGWMAVDLKVIIENAKNAFTSNVAEPIIKVSADDEFCSNEHNPDTTAQDDTFSVISVDRLSVTTTTEVNLRKSAASPFTNFSEEDDRMENVKSSLKPQFSVTSMDRYEPKVEKEHVNLFEFLQSIKHVFVNINSFYKQEYDRLSDEELMEILVNKRKNGGISRVRLKTFPVDLQFEISAKCGEDLKQQCKNILSPELSKMYMDEDISENFNTEMNIPFFKDILVFSRPNTFSVNHFYRNLLYIYPKHVNLSAKSGNCRNVCVKVQLCNSKSELMPIIYQRDGRFVREYSCVVSYHSKTPQFLDEIKVHIPMEINDGYYALFSFYHISCRAAKQNANESVETPIGYTWLPLFVNGELQVGDFSLPISLDPLPAGICYLSPLLNVPNLRWLDNHKCLFNVGFQAVSTVHPQDNHLNNFFRVYNALKCSDINQQSASSTKNNKPHVDECQLKDAIHNIIKSRPEPMVSFLYIIIDKLLALISCPPFPDTAKYCFETMCQLVKVGTMLLDGGNVDELGRSQLFLSYIYYHKLTQNDLLYSLGTLCEQIEAAAAAALASGKRSEKHSDEYDVVDLIKTYEKMDFKNSLPETDNVEFINAEDLPNRKLLHEEIMYHFANSTGSVRETACLYSWFFFELTLKAMAEYLSARNRFFLPRKLRFREEFYKSVRGTVKLIIVEIFEKFSKDFRQTKYLNNSLAFFLRDALLLMDRTFVLKQAKLYHNEMAKKINHTSSSLQSHLISLKLAFLRIVCSHEHFLFLNLPFESMLKTSAFACSSSTNNTCLTNNTNGLLGDISHYLNNLSDKHSQCAKDLSEEYLQNHFLLGILFSDLSAIINSLRNTSAISTHLLCLEEAVKFVQVLLLCHENDIRLTVDTALKYRIALLYLPLVGIAIDSIDCLYDPFKDGVDLSDVNLYPNRSFDEISQNVDAIQGLVLSKELTKELLISFCWVISNVEKSALLRYLQGFSASSMCRFVDVLQLCVLLFEYRPDSASFLNNDNVSTCGTTIVDSSSNFSRGKSASVVQNNYELVGSETSVVSEAKNARDLLSSDQQSQIHQQTLPLNRKQSCGTQSFCASHGGCSLDMANSLVDFSSYAGSICSVNCCCRDTTSFSCCKLDGIRQQQRITCNENNCSMRNKIGNSVRWRSNEQLLKTATASVKSSLIKSAKEMEILFERSLCNEVCFATLSTVETIIELAELPSLEAFRFIIPSLIQLLTHMMSCNASVEALESIFYVQRRIVAEFSELIFEQRTELCTEMCYQLLRHMASRLPVIRSQAAGSLYLLMRNSYVRSQTFARVKIQVTMSLSSLVSNSLTRSQDETHPLSEHCLRRSLKTMLDYMESDIFASKSKIVTTTSEKLKDTNFSSQVKSLALNLHMILSDTVKMKLYSNDYEMLIDLMYRIAKGYQNNPDLRITWLLSMANKHLERDNFMEAAHCALHCAALVSEYLAMLHYDCGGYANDASNFLKLLPQSADEFAEISGNIFEESAISDDVINPEEEGICESSHFSVEGFVNLVEKCLLFFEKAQAYELVPSLYKLILPVFEAQRHHFRLGEIYRSLADNEKRIEPAPKIYENVSDAFASSLTGSDKRCFGTYFRVAFFGSKFGDLNRQEFIYKEPFITKLSEISHRLETFYAEKFGSRTFVELIKDSTDVDLSQLDEEKAYIQITYVEPYFELWERRRRSSHFYRHYGLNAFAYATPFTIGGRAHGLLDEQFKRRTILRTHNNFPYVKTRLCVISRECIVLAPIQVAIEDIEKKTRELASAIALQPPDPKILQMFLQGCIGTTVNVGPIQIARVFLSSDNDFVLSRGIIDKSEFAKCQEHLRLCFKEFSKRCYDALCINATLIDAERATYQNELRKNYADFTSQLAEILAYRNDKSAHVSVNYENDGTHFISAHLHSPATAV